MLLALLRNLGQAGGNGVTLATSAAYKKVFVVSAAGRVKWVSYIPVKQYPSTTTYERNRFDDLGALDVYFLSSVTGLREWVDYIPVVEVTDPDSGKWRYNDTGFIPVLSVTP